MSGKSFCQIYVHAIWHIKFDSVEIKDEHKSHLYSTIFVTIKKEECTPVIVNGTGNHVHILMIMSKDCAVKDVIARIKRTTSFWLHNLDPYYSKFSWQTGYAAFSVSQSVVDKTVTYIKNQESHHKKMSFEEELKRFLNLYHVEYNPKFIAKYD